MSSRDDSAFGLLRPGAASAGLSLDRMLVVGVVLAAFALRVAGLGAGSLWEDEGYTVLPPSVVGWDIPSAIPIGTFSLYYRLVQLWTAVAGGSEFALRFPSVASGIALVAAVFVLGRRLGGPAVGVTAAALVATSPPLIAHSQTARPYSLVVLLMVLSFLAILRISDGVRRWCWWLLAMASLIAAAYAHLYALTGLPATLLILGWVAVRDGRQRWCLTLSLVGLGGALLPWAIRSALSTYDHVAARAAVNPLSPLEFGDAVRHSLLAMDTSSLTRYDPLGVALVLGLLLGWHALWQRSRQSATVTAVYSLTPLLVGYEIDRLVPYFNGRYLLFLAPFVFITIAGVLAYRKRSWAAIAGIPLFMIGVSQLPQVYQQVFVAPREDLATLATELRARFQPGDVLISNSTWRQMNLDYYLRGLGVPVVVIPMERPATVDQIRREVLEAADPHERAWVAFFGAPDGDAVEATESILSEQYARVSNNWYGTTRLALYERAHGLSAPRRSAHIIFGDALELVDYALPAPLSAQPGGSVAAPLRWRLRRLGTFAVSLRLVDPKDQVLAQSDARLGDGYLRATDQSVGDEIVEVRGLTVPWGTPPGRYDLTITAHDAETGAGLGAKDGDGRAIPPAWVLGSIDVHPAVAAPPLDLLPIQERRTEDLGSLRLLGGSWSQKVATGQSIQVELFWQATVAPGESDDLEILVVDHRGKVWGATREPIDQGRSTGWQAGEVRFGRYRIRVPLTLPAGRYRLWVQVMPGDRQDPTPGRRTSVDLGSIEVESRPRRFDVPAIQHQLQAEFARRTELLGYDLVGVRPSLAGTFDVTAGDRLSLSLYWRAATELGLDEPERSYTVFVQVLDASGRLVAQHDGIPAGGDAPTNTWADGEVVEDQHALALPADLPPGRYAVITGLYDGRTMERLPTETSDHVVLAHVIVR